MTQARVPASVVISLSVHAGALFLFMGFVHEAPKHAAQIVEGVDLLIAPSRPRVEAAKPALSTMDFLKMALPSTPRRAQLAAVDVKLERKTKLAEAPKLEDEKRRDLAPKLEALDLARSRVSAAKIDAEPMSRRRAAQTLAALPKLEEVGRRRVKNLPEALALEDKRREATTLLGGALEAPAPTSRRQVMAAAAKLEEAQEPIARPSTRKGFSVLPEQLELKPRPDAAMTVRPETIGAAPKLERRQAAAATEEGPKKGVEIEGPLKDRQVTGSVIPPFPDWAKTQGMMEAEVAIRFTVGPEGAVLPGMRIERGSGYGRLDRLCMESLRSWTFAPAPGSGAQWGIITFRFLLE
ncbi:MAG: TonB family protein [Elusimicrobia bacterium]|nr:TonB family protein [Elusimicrobiota bacterium]